MSSTQRFSEADYIDDKPFEDYQFPLTGPSQYDDFRRSDNIDDRRKDLITESLSKEPEKVKFTRDQILMWLDKNPEEATKLAKQLGVKDIKK